MSTGHRVVVAAWRFGRWVAAAGIAVVGVVAGTAEDPSDWWKARGRTLWTNPYPALQLWVLFATVVLLLIAVIWLAVLVTSRPIHGNDHDVRLFQRIVQRIPPDGDHLQIMKTQFFASSVPLYAIEPFLDIDLEFRGPGSHFDDRRLETAWETFRKDASNFESLSSNALVISGNDSFLTVFPPGAVGDFRTEQNAQYFDEADDLTTLARKVGAAYDNFYTLARKRLPIDVTSNDPIAR